ncbi:putative T7SS-secreted protein [Kitasatospora sp. NPDC096140]|uniref:putative T7SS-secreted protein n=1 Tax=Kitasatospora sp. NPDC096140 TaxID=3155425 RepID=UPI003319EF91
MAKELGQTSDPHELIPGNPDAIDSTCAWLTGYGDTLHSAGMGLKRIDTVEGWSGPAGEAFRKAFKGTPGKWLEAGDCFHAAANALTSYQHALTWAQGQAADAIKQWDEAQAATSTAKVEHEEAEKNAGHPVQFNDPGDSKRDAARHTLDNARSQLKTAGDNAANKIAKARDKAPEEPDWLDDVGDFLSDAGDFLMDVGKTAAEDLASVGNAMIHDPGATLEVAGGLGLALLGAGGEVVGTALDATGVGAVIGVPANVVSASAIVGGLSLAGAGMEQIMQDASGPDRVNMQSNGGGGGGGGIWSSTPPGETPPSGAADPAAKPTGRVTNIPKNADATTQRSLGRENESAEILARNGYKVEQNPNVPGAKNPDYRVEGEIMDCMSPTSDKPINVTTEMQKKVNKGQADRIVLNMQDSPLSQADILQALKDKPVNGLREVKVIDQAGNVVHLYP